MIGLTRVRNEDRRTGKYHREGERKREREREGEREAVFQAIYHKQPKTRLTLNGCGRESRCHVYARAHKSRHSPRQAIFSTNRPFLRFYAAETSCTLCGERGDATREGDSKMNMYTYIAAFIVC